MAVGAGTERVGSSGIRNGYYEVRGMGDSGGRKNTSDDFALEYCSWNEWA